MSTFILRKGKGGRMNPHKRLSMGLTDLLILLLSVDIAEHCAD